MKRGRCHECSIGPNKKNARTETVYGYIQCQVWPFYKALERVGEIKKEWSMMMLVRSPKKGERNKEIWRRDYIISEGEVKKRIQNQAWKNRTTKVGAVGPRGNRIELNTLLFPKKNS